MTSYFTERLRRDDLMILADEVPTLLDTVAPSRRPVHEPETVLLVPIDADVPMQALALARYDFDPADDYDHVEVFAFVPLAFGPVQERAR